MNICAIIAEYNPFHNGHLKQIDYVKNVLKADKIIVIMSGNFTQRGEGAVLDKYTRAKHAILGGADMVIELPTVFATSNAELFGKGAVKIIEDLGIINTLCFGVESGKKEDFIKLATILNNESKEFKALIKKELDSGLSFVKAKTNAIKTLYQIDESFVSSPNNVLGIEYTRALLKLKSKIEIAPMLRKGDHNDKKLYKKITSASSIRENLGKKKVKSVVPSFVYKDLKPLKNFDKILLSKILTTDTEKLSKVLDCTEGLENRIKSLTKESYSVKSLVEKVATKRYTEARIRRIFVQNSLNIEQKLITNSLKQTLYAKVLATSDNELLSLITKNGKIPLIIRKSDYSLLSDYAKKVFDIDILAGDIYGLVDENKQNEFYTLMI
ncbi:MAG: nucleotidyltransferase family protein [Clostridiales bacterium]|nr:nucleotidyltransferase family protein [Clostridiales bacterium]